jgi:hypothetical protein
MRITKRNNRRRVLSPLTSIIASFSLVLLGVFGMNPAKAEDDLDSGGDNYEEVDDYQPVDVSTVSEYELSLDFVCEGSINAKSSKCRIYPRAFIDNAELNIVELVGKIEVSVCAYVDGSGKDKTCARSTKKAKGKSSKGTDLPVDIKHYIVELGETSFVKMQNFTYGNRAFQEVLVQDSMFLATASDFWFGSGKKDMSITLTTPKNVMLGETHSFKIRANPKVNAKCKLYRSNFGSSTEVGTATMRKGVASGKLRWFWTTNGNSVAMSLKAVCTADKFSGETFALVTGFRQ